MNKSFFFALLLLTSTFAHAQTPYDWGIRGGLQWSQFYGSNFVGQVPNSNKTELVSTSSNAVEGIAVGAYIRSKESFFIQGEALFSMKGGQLDRNANGTVTNYEVKFSQLDLPFSLGYRYGTFEVFGGPMVSLQLFNDNKLQDFLNQYALSQAKFSPYRPLVFGYHVGVGANFGKVSVNLRNLGSIQNAANAIITYPPTAASSFNQSYFTQRSGSWQISVGYKIGGR